MTRDLDVAGPAGEEPGRRLVLLRHGRTAWNAAGRAQGHADVGLDEVGHAQAAAAAPYLASLEPAALWTSDLARARQTADPLAKETGLTAVEDPRLREFDVGIRQGLTLAEFAERHPEEHTRWSRHDDVRLTGAETAGDVEARMLPALRACLEELPAGQTGVVVTHGACLKVGVVGLLGWPRAQSSSLGGVDNCAWVTIEELGHQGRLRLVGYNESVRPGHDAQQLADEA
ncbi:MAG: histidine phosphatase family protein [Nocardioidaceae bacterium]